MLHSEVMAKVALIEDDRLQAMTLSAILSSDGHQVTHFADAAAYRRAERAFDLVVLDWGLPGDSGFALLNELRNGVANDLPVLMVTARSLEDDVRAALDAGADDYVSKPARPFELAARVRRLLRRRGASAAAGIADLSPYALDPERSVVMLHGEPIQLTAREYAIASCLVEAAGTLVPRVRLEHDVLGLAPTVRSRTLDSHISRLRTKLALDGRYGWTLIAVYQRGYLLKRN
jgi:DNA-binding response OmpR family regulator